MARKRSSKKQGDSANLGFEEKLWAAADKMRGHMDTAEYKHVVLGLIFLKYISDAFEERRVMLEQLASDPASDWYVKEPSQRYEVLEEDDEPFDEKMQRLTNTLARQFKEGAKLEKAIMKSLSSLGFSPKEPV